MSAGNFLRSRYAASYGAGTAIHPIRVQPETLAASIGGTTNDPPEGAISNPISASVSRGKREKGLKPRTISIQFPATGQPTGYKASGTTVIVGLTIEFWNLAIPGAVINYLGVACTVIGRSAEEAE
jgi:hypothetical protein